MNHLIKCLFPLIIFSLKLSTAFDTITATLPLTPNNTLTSHDSVFQLGFFSTDNNKIYIGIWYKNLPTRTVVWVANTESPLTNLTAVFKITDSGNLALTDQSETAIWQTNITTGLTTRSTTGSSIVAQLLDTGNLVVRYENDDDPEDYLWQSFDYPTDTLLPGMKLGIDKRTGTDRFLTSWRTKDDPKRGVFVFKLNPKGFPAYFLWHKDVLEYRSGPWNGIRFSGVPEMGPSYNLTFTFVMNSDEVAYSFEINEKGMYSRLVVNSFGILQRLIWIETSQSWNLFWYAPADQCDIFKECGVYGVCDTNHSPVCKCMKGFEPRNKQAWSLRDGSGGCLRTTELNCKDDGFLPLKNMKLPESSEALFNKSMTVLECKEQCRRNCLCTAYASMDIRAGGSGCVMWTGELVDMREYAAAGGGQEMFVRVSANVLDAGSTASEKSSNDTGKTRVAVAIAVGGGVVLLALIILIARKRKKMQRTKKEKISYRAPQERSQDYVMNDGVLSGTRDYSSESRTDEFELPIFDLSTMLLATENFSDENKVGQGGFGIVYKGMLGESQQIAVKRLSKTSVQGIDEFKNEIRLIARLQHRNLVRLLGGCVEMEEKILIYEYMENKSLDAFLFKKERSTLLDWQTRFNIICGIARGLLYLHQDSRFRIIHRDLKASNILLDKDMNPKISDFGMARIFGGDQTEANTKKVVGTYGYMSPEYAMDGLFSIKSDVFSFGVLVMEIVTGKKNRGFYNVNLQLNLLGHAWRLWKEGKGLELLDPSAGEIFSSCEVLRCIQVGLLCVQERAEDRPNMSSVVLMLGSENPSMPQPKNPGFCVGRHSDESETSSSKIEESCSVNQLTVTVLDGR